VGVVSGIPVGVGLTAAGALPPPPHAANANTTGAQKACLTPLPVPNSTRDDDYEAREAGTDARVHENGAPEAGFTLIEVLIATALFVFVAVAGFEVLRGLGWNVNLIAQRNAAAAQLDVVEGMLRSEALSAVAVWKPASTCGDAVEFMQRTAAGTSFLLYATRAANLVRASAAGPMNPCDDTLQTQTVVPAVARFAVTRVPASGLPAHADPVSGNVDGGLFMPGSITSIAVDSHAADFDGSQIATGNDVIEVTLDADPVRTTVDLLAGNRPSAYTQVLAYACNGRCEATGAFPEIRNAAFTDCVPGYDFQNSATYYVPAAFGAVAAARGNQRIVVTAYNVTGGYTFAFSGPVPTTAERTWPVGVWPPAGSALAGTIADAYPVDYANNAIATRGAAQIAADLGAPAAFAADLTACGDMHADPTFDD
jgi:prepilin-type N-terminal cleavage/methylation domain-containing protein